MPPISTRRPSALSAADSFAGLPSALLALILFPAVALSHLTLLRLPYYWDEGGYYIPAALDFFHTRTLIPHFTNAHPPLPNVLLGSLWHLAGFHILTTRLLVCAFAAAALLAIFRLTQRLLGAPAAIAVTFLTAVYPIWFAQSTLAHADIFAATFTLWAFVVYACAATASQPPAICHLDRGLEASSRDAVERPLYSSAPPQDPLRNGRVFVAALFTLAVLSKETAIVQPATLAAIQLILFIRNRRNAKSRDNHLRWLAALAFPALPLAAWFVYHRARTGFTFGNPEYLRYNATANFTAAHILSSLRYRFIHFFWQRNMWFAIALAAACLCLPHRLRNPRITGESPTTLGLPRQALATIAALLFANWIAFSILGGALLTRYLLPVYPLTLVVCVAIWQSRTRHWPWLAALTAAAFISGLWLNPPTAFAPEDNLTYRNAIVVQQQAIDYVAQHFPDATILTAWPVAADVFRPELGYVDHPLKATSIENFTLPEIRKAAQEPDRFDTAIVFTTSYVSPALRRYWLTHPTTRRGREFAADRDLTPREIAAMLGGTIVWQNDLDGEWAAVLRFNRTYEAQLENRRGTASQAAEKVLEFRLRLNYEGSCAVMMGSKWVYSAM